MNGIRNFNLKEKERHDKWYKKFQSQDGTPK
jgi:hypothetical protein